jgi:hypothetical protein
MDRTLIGLQDSDLRLFPVILRRRLRRLRSDLDPTPVDGDHRHFGARTVGVRDGVLGHEGKSLIRRDGRASLVDSLPADLRDQSLDRLGLHPQIGQFGQITRGLEKRLAVDTGMDDLLLDARAEAAVVNAQGLILRGKKPSGSGGSWRRAASRRRLPAWS